MRANKSNKFSHCHSCGCLLWGQAVGGSGQTPKLMLTQLALVPERFSSIIPLDFFPAFNLHCVRYSSLPDRHNFLALSFGSLPLIVCPHHKVISRSCLPFYEERRKNSRFTLFQNYLLSSNNHHFQCNVLRRLFFLYFHPRHKSR